MMRMLLELEIERVKTVEDRLRSHKLANQTPMPSHVLRSRDSLQSTEKHDGSVSSDITLVPHPVWNYELFLVAIVE